MRLAKSTLTTNILENLQTYKSNLKGESASL